MSSKRSKLTDAQNINGSKNTRLMIDNNLRADQLAHLSRYDACVKYIRKERSRLKRPVDVLEVGAGDLWIPYLHWGAYTDKKSDTIRSYTAYDIDSVAVGVPAIQPKIEGLYDFKYIFTDLTVNPLSNDDETVDVYINTEVLEHIQPEFVPVWISEAARVLRPGGRAYISTPNSDGSNVKLPKDHIKEWGYQELRDELEKHFIVEEVYGTFGKINNIKKAVKEQSAKDGRPNLSQDQFDHIEKRFGKHWVRVVSAMFYPEVSNNCNWILRKK